MSTGAAGAVALVAVLITEVVFDDTINCVAVVLVPVAAVMSWCRGIDLDQADADPDEVYPVGDGGAGLRLVGRVAAIRRRPPIRARHRQRRLRRARRASRSCGAVEAALIAGLVAAGLDNTVAVPAVFLYRLFTFWVPILPGWLAFQWLEAKEYI